MNNNQSRHAGHCSSSRPGRRTHAAAPDVQETEAIGTIRAGQGARVTTRRNAAQAADRARHNAEERYFERHPEARGSSAGPERSRKNVLVLVLAAILVLLVVFFVGRCVTALVAPGPAEQATQQEVQQGAGEKDTLPEDAPQEQVDPAGTVSYRGTTYALTQQESGRMGLVATNASGSQEVLFEIEGTPVALMRRGSTLLIPENRGGEWDVACYVIAGHSDPSYVATMDGNKVSGSGDITSAQLDDAVIHVTDSTGATTDVALE